MANYEDAVVALKYLISDECTDTQFDYVEEIETAISTLEKQISKFVLCPKGFQGLRDTRFYCPSCKSLTRQHEEFCHKCGQHVKYPKEVYQKENSKWVFDWGEEK